MAAGQMVASHVALAPAPRRAMKSRREDRA
jgi:hypothetical protein